MTDYDQAAEYRRGYEDGARSLDAERASVAARLRELDFSGLGSHENLTAIAEVILPDACYGWTVGACERLRDRIVELMGGAHVPRAIETEEGSN